MLQACSPSHDWLCDSKPLLFDDEFCPSLMKDLQSIPTPPQSPPMKPGLAKNLSTVDQLELVSELLTEDNDFLQLDWNFTDSASAAEDPLLEDCLWRTDGDKPIEDKLSAVLSTSPLLSDVNTEIFAEITGCTLDCHNVALSSQALESADLPLDTQGQIEPTSDYGSLSTGGESSTSDSVEKTDVVTIWQSSTPTCSQHQQQLEDSRREQQCALNLIALSVCHFKIQQQHNIIIPWPAFPPPPPPPLKHSRGSGDSHRSTHNSGHSQSLASQQAVDTEDKERRMTHNAMERQRRNKLKNGLLRLQDNIPELSNNDKASTVVILQCAKESIRNLETENHRLTQKKDKLRERQEQLKVKLGQLERL